MRLSIPLLGLLSAGISAPAMAAEAFDFDAETIVYIRHQFGSGSEAQNRTSTGFTMDYSKPLAYRHLPDMIDVEFNNTGLSSFRVNGMDVLIKEYRLHGNGEGVAVKGVHWAAMASGLAGIGVLGAAVLNGDNGPQRGGTESLNEETETTDNPLDDVLGSIEDILGELPIEGLDDVVGAIDDILSGDLEGGAEAALEAIDAVLGNVPGVGDALGDTVGDIGEVLTGGLFGGGDTGNTGGGLFGNMSNRSAAAAAGVLYNEKGQAVYFDALGRPIYE